MLGALSGLMFITSLAAFWLSTFIPAVIAVSGMAFCAGGLFGITSLAFYIRDRSYGNLMTARERLVEAQARRDASYARRDAALLRRDAAYAELKFEMARSTTPGRRPFRYYRDLSEPAVNKTIEELGKIRLLPAGNTLLTPDEYAAIDLGIAAGWQLHGNDYKTAYFTYYAYPADRWTPDSLGFTNQYLIQGFIDRQPFVKEPVEEADWYELPGS